MTWWECRISDINWLHLQRWHYGNIAVNGLTVTKLCLEYSFYRFFSSCVTSQLEYMLTNYMCSHYNAAWILLQIHTFICIQTSPSVLWLRVKWLCNGFDCLWTLQQHPVHRKKKCYWKNYYYQSGGGKHNLYGFSNCWTGNELWNSCVKHSFLVTFTLLDLLYWS